MDDYRKLYDFLFNGITDEIERPKELQCAAEELFEKMGYEDENAQAEECS